jgi:hypothetical protein
MIAILLGLSTLSLVWSPFKLLLPLLAGVILLPIAQACLSAVRASFNDAPHSRATRLRRCSLTAALHLLQPLARLRGRLAHGLVPWLRRGRAGLAPPWPRTLAFWSEHWQDPNERLRCIERDLRAAGAAVRCGATTIAGTWRLAAGCSARPGCSWPSRITGPARSSSASAAGRAPAERVRPHRSLRGPCRRSRRSRRGGGVARRAILAAVALALALCTTLECASAAALVARTVGQRGNGGA